MAQVSEISATSTVSFEDAIRQGLARAAEPHREVRRAWIKRQQTRIGEASVPEYQVDLLVTFVETSNPAVPEAGPVGPPVATAR